MTRSTSSVTFLPEDSLKVRLKKAAHVCPSPEQYLWMDKELTAFIHFGPNTFTGRQWGSGHETLRDYMHGKPDPEQWVRVCAEAGLKHVICTLKHHDGFCLWHTETTDFSVKNTAHPLDVAGVLSDACRKYGIGFGVYLSPWDMHQREAGLWGTDAYNDYFLRQLKEVLTGYGPVEELWFDGACGDWPIWQKVPCYRPETWYEMIHRLQPQAVYRMYDPYFFADEAGWKDLKDGKALLSWAGKAVRWVGNEEGRSRTDEWNMQPVFEPAIAKNAVLPDLGSVKYYEQAVGAVWYPVEVNTTILNQWFWNPETSRVKSLEQLAETYYQSVGNNGVLLLNLSPDRNGLIPDDQIHRLMELRRFIDRTFSQNLAEGAAIRILSDGSGNMPDTACTTANTKDAPVYEILSEDPEKFWEGSTEWDMDTSSAVLEIKLPQPMSFDQVMLSEHIRDGQRIACWSLSVLEDGVFREVARKGSAGRKCLRRFTPVHADTLRLTIHQSYDTPQISGFGLFMTQLPKPENPPVGSDETRVQGATLPSPGIDLSSLAILSLPEGTEPGLACRLCKGGLQSIADAGNARKIPGIMLRLRALDPAELPCSTDFHAEFTGWIRVKEDGVYVFSLGTADAGALFIADRLCIRLDEPHDYRSEQVHLHLSAGFYPLRFLYTSFRHSAAFCLDTDAACPDARDKRISLL